MADIRFDTGVKGYTINGSTSVSFSPTDMAFIEKVYRAMDNLDRKQEDFKTAIDAAKDTEVFDLAREIDAEVREEINAVFGFDICTSVFGGMSTCTIADGFPVWANFILAIVDQFEGAFAEEKKKTNPRIKKYTAKYKK